MRTAASVGWNATFQADPDFKPTWGDALSKAVQQHRTGNALLDLSVLRRKYQLPRSLDAQEYRSAFAAYILPELPCSEALSTSPDERLQSDSFCPFITSGPGMPPAWATVESCLEGTPQAGYPAIHAFLRMGMTPTVGTPAELVLPPDPQHMLDEFLHLHPGSDLTVGARALTKHATRSTQYGNVTGTPAMVGLHALVFFAEMLHDPAHQNIFCLPHGLLAYEIRRTGGRGMRFEKQEAASDTAWRFRGFVEPVMINGHELGWRETTTQPGLPSDA